MDCFPVNQDEHRSRDSR